MKPGRPEKDPARRRKRKIICKLTEPEHNRLRLWADVHDEEISRLIRSRLVDIIGGRETTP